MIVEMLTGHFPFEAVYQDELERKIQRENPNLQGVSSEWLDIAKGCLTRDHNRRWAAADVLEALDSIGVAIPKKQPPTIPQPKPSSQKTTPVHASPSRSNGLWGTAITIGLVSGVGFIIWQNMKSVNSPPIISSPSPTSTPSSEPLSVIPTITSSPSQNETVSSKTATDFFTDGLKKYNEKDFKGAIADYNKAILINPNLADAYGNRGNAKSALGDKQGAIADYNEAIDLNPNLSEAYYNRAPVQMELGNPQRAIDDYTEAIRLQPDFAGAYVGRGKASVALGYKRKIFQNLYIDILKDYSEAIRIKPDYGDAYNNRGMIKYQIKDYQGAIADYSQTILVEPDSPYPYRNRGTAKFALGDKQGAIDDFDKAIYLKPDYDLAYYNRGLVKKETGEVQEALADFRKALELYQQQGNTEWYNNSRDRIRELGG
jgi:tetratricopeptide (TPR) repeat protein